jgi:hypothetical protein
MKETTLTETEKFFIATATGELSNTIDALLNDGADPYRLRKVMADFSDQQNARLTAELEAANKKLEEAEADAWLVGRLEYAQLQGDVLIEAKDGEGFIVILHSDSEDERFSLGAFDTLPEAIAALAALDEKPP